LTGANPERHEAELFVEGDCVRLGVDHDADTTQLVRHRVREREDRL
jgi:hypothetical protein